jgi:hypothetical protein
MGRLEAVTSAVEMNELEGAVETYKGLNADHEREEFAAYILLPRVRSFLAREQNSTI